MLLKCANPKCSHPFKYLHQGKLFCLAAQSARGRETSLNGKRTAGGVEYFWLCGPCSSVFTLIFDESRGVSLAPVGDGPDHNHKAEGSFALVCGIGAPRLLCHEAD